MAPGRELFCAHKMYLQFLKMEMIDVVDLMKYAIVKDEGHQNDRLYIHFQRL